MGTCSEPAGQGSFQKLGKWDSVLSMTKKKEIKISKEECFRFFTDLCSCFYDAVKNANLRWVLARENKLNIQILHFNAQSLFHIWKYIWSMYFVLAGKQMTSKVTYGAVWNNGFEFDLIIALKMMQFHQVNSSVIWIRIKMLTGQRTKADLPECHC